MIGEERINPTRLGQRPALAIDHQQIDRRAAEALTESARRRSDDRRATIAVLCLAAGLSVGGLLAFGWGGAALAAGCFALGWVSAAVVAGAWEAAR